MGREELKCRQLAHHQLMSQLGHHFSPHSTANAKDKNTNPRKNDMYWYKCCSFRFSILRRNKFEEDDFYDNYYYY